MSNAKDDNSVNLNPEEFSLGIKVSPTTEIAPATETTANSKIALTAKKVQTEEFSWTTVPDTQVHQPYTPTQNFSCQAPAPMQPVYFSSNVPNIVPFPNVGLTYPMMQQANNQVLKGFIDIDLSVMKYRAMSEEKLRQKQIFDQYEDSRKKTTGLQQGDEFVIASSLDWKKLEDSFATKYSIVKIRVQGKADWKYAFLDHDDNRHIIVEETYIKNEYLSYVDEQLADSINFPQAHFNRSTQRLIHRIPRLEKSDLIQLQPQQVMMNNGFLDLHTLEFTPIAPEKRHNFFTLFSLEIDFNPNMQNPDAFDALLLDSLGSKEAVTLAYEQIGAILTPVTTIKKIFVFQGKSQGGKTRLSNIITRLMPSNDTKAMSSLSEISVDKPLDTLVRLIYVKEVGKNKLPAKQIVKLKAFADGSDLREANAFKILLNTNYPIVTGDNLSLEPALANRLSVLPFPKTMDNIDPAVASFEDVHFEQEKPAIILKALLAFSKVLNNKNQFSSQFEPNTCIEDDGQPISNSLSDTDRQNFSNAINDAFKTSEINTPSKLSQLFNEMFQIVETINPIMTTNLIFRTINKALPNTLKDPASTGKRLNQHFGEKLKTNRNNQGDTCYNLIFTNVS